MADTIARLRALLAEAAAIPLHQAGIADDGSVRDPHWAREVRLGDGRAFAWCGDIAEPDAHAAAALIAAAINALPALLEVAEAARERAANGHDTYCRHDYRECTCGHDDLAAALARLEAP